MTIIVIVSIWIHIIYGDIALYKKKNDNIDDDDDH